MGVMLSVLLSYMGAIEFVFIVRDLTHQIALHQMRLNNDQRRQSDINIIQDKIKASINELESVEEMQDGVFYKDGYRIDPENAIDGSVEVMQDGVLYRNGYRIDCENLTGGVTQQWNERRKAMCVPENDTNSTIEEVEQKSIVTSGSTEIIAISNERTTNENDNAVGSNDDSKEQNYRSIVRDDRTGNTKDFKKRPSFDFQSSGNDSIRLSREEELKFNSIPINYANDSSVKGTKSNVNMDPTFQAKEKYGSESDTRGDVEKSNFHDSSLWKRESAALIVEETGNHTTNKGLPTDNHNSISKTGTADKPSRKTPCENDELDACVLLEHIDKAYSLTQYDENASLEAFEEHDPEQTNTNLTMKKCDKQSNLMEYFNNSSDVKPQDDGSNDQAVQITIDTPNDIVDPNINGTKSRDDRSSTVYSRTDSETSNLFYKSKSRDSSSSGYVEQAYNRSDSSNSCIQDELDSEEYHHYHRFSMTADALEYIRGRDDWKVHTENKLNDLYRRQSSIISIQEEIDSDEYHHNRVLSDIIQMAYLEPDSNQSLPSLPSSFEEDKVFDRYYLELEQIKDHLSNDIEQNIAQKQLILLDSSDVQHTEGYVYPLPDIVLDQIVDRNDTPYMFDIQLGSDYENVMSESEDDVQSVIEVNRDDKYEREIIATLDVDSKIDEMIEVTVWDLKTDLSKEMSSKEYAVGIIRSTNENLIQDVDFEQTIEGGTETSNNEEVTAPTDDRKAIIDEVDKLNDEVNMVEVLDNVKDTPGLKSTETEHVLQIETTETLPDVIDGSLENDSSTSNLNRSFIEHERSSSVLQSANPSLPVMPAVKKVSKIIKKVTSYENVDDLIKEGCMGVWFHN